jgi:hypothetical protein
MTEIVMEAQIIIIIYRVLEQHLKACGEGDVDGSDLEPHHRSKGGVSIVFRGVTWHASKSRAENSSKTHILDYRHRRLVSDEDDDTLPGDTCRLQRAHEIEDKVLK